jgi:F-type H+-transporting ATPase subunit b
MIILLSQFAKASQSGIGAFNVNAKSFLFQLLTFLFVLLVLRKWVFPKLVSTIEQRQKILEDSLVQAKKTEETLAKAETKAEEIIAKARDQADQALADAKKASAGVITDAEAAAAKRAELIVKEAETRLDEERQKLRQELRGEMAHLVAYTTEKVIDEKLDKEHDLALIERKVKELVR